MTWFPGISAGRLEAPDGNLALPPAGAERQQSMHAVCVPHFFAAMNDQINSDLPQLH